MTATACWIDVETTGLDPETEHLLEIGVVAVDARLEEVAHESWLVYYDGPVSAFIANMHGPSGTDLLRLAKMHGRKLEDVVPEIHAFLATHFSGKITVGGDSPHFDVRWLTKHTPTVAKNFHHRVIDVSGMSRARELFAAVPDPKDYKNTKHRSLDDCRDSIARLKTILGMKTPQQRKAEAEAFATLANARASGCMFLGPHTAHGDCPGLSPIGGAP